jgi:hypothetical protein
MGWNAEFCQNMENPDFASNIQMPNKPWQLQTPTPLPHEHTPSPWLSGQHHQEQYGTLSPIPRPHRMEDTTTLHYSISQTLQAIKRLADLAKLYNNEEIKYGGDTYEVIESKLLILYDCCCHLGIPAEQYSNTLPTMLKGRVLTFYYDRLCNTPKLRNFQDMVSRVKAHFKNEERSQMYLLDWRNTTLLKVINENPGKPKYECLELLFDKLTNIQWALPSIGSLEESLRIQIFNACQGI